MQTSSPPELGTLLQEIQSSINNIANVWWWVLPGPRERHVLVHLWCMGALLCGCANELASIVRVLA